MARDSAIATHSISIGSDKPPIERPADPYLRDHILFYDFFHGDNGAGICASYHTGWSGLVVRLLQFHSFVSDFEADFMSAMAYIEK